MTNKELIEIVRRTGFATGVLEGIKVDPMQFNVHAIHNAIEALWDVQNLIQKQFCKDDNNVGEDK